MFYKFKQRDKNNLIYSNKYNMSSIKVSTVIIIILVSLFIYAGDGIVQEKAGQIDNLYGKYHIELGNVDGEKLNIIKKNKYVQRVGTVEYLSMNAIKERWIAARIGYYDEISRDLLNMEIVAGKYPTKKGEIVFEKWILDNLDLGKTKKINDYVTLDNSKNTDTRYYSDVLPEYYKIVGLLGGQGSGKESVYTPALVSKSQVNSISSYDKKYYLYLRLRNAYEADRVKEILVHNLGIDEEKIKINDKYIRELRNIDIMNTYRIVLSIIIIMTTTIILNNIYSNFNYDKVRNLGILRAIGATKKQIYSVIIHEIFIINIKALIIGLGLGILAYPPTVKLLSMYDINVKGGSINFENIMFILICSMILTAFVITLNIMKINELSVLELLSLNSKIKYVKEISSNKIWVKLYKYIGIIEKLSFKNILKYSKKSKKAILLISSACVIFIVLNSIKPDAYNIPDGMDLFIRTEKMGYTSVDTKKLLSIEGIKDVSSIQNITAYVNIKKEVQKIFKLEGDNASYIKVKAIGFEKNIFEDSKLIAGRINISELSKQKKVLVNEAFMRQYGGKLNDIIELNIPYLKISTVKYGRINAEIKGVVEIDKVPVEYDPKTPYVFIHKDILNLATGYRFYNQLNISLDRKRNEFNEEEFREIFREISNIASARKGIAVSVNEDKIRNYEEDYKDYKEKTKVLTLIMLFIVTLISILSILSASNELVINRARELSMYRIIGMTAKQMRKMIVLEGFFLGTISSVLGIGIGTSIMIILKKQIEAATAYTVDIHYKWLVVLFIGINIMSILFSLTSLRTIQNKKIAESIRMIK